MAQLDFDRLEAEIPHLRRYARALTRDIAMADDLVQDCLERAITKQHRFDPKTNLRSWLFTILHNIHIDDRRKVQRRGVSVPIEDWHSHAATEPSQEWTMEMRAFLRNFRRLNRQEQQVLKLVAVDGHPYDVVADLMGVALGTVKSRLFRARRKLREIETSGTGVNGHPASARAAFQ